MLIKLNDGERLVIETNDKHPQRLVIICEGNWLGVGSLQENQSMRRGR